MKYSCFVNLAFDNYPISPILSDNNICIINFLIFIKEIDFPDALTYVSII